MYNGSDDLIFKHNETIVPKENRICCCSYDWSGVKCLNQMLLCLESLLEENWLKFDIIGEKHVGIHLESISEKAKNNITLN